MDRSYGADDDARCSPQARPAAPDTGQSRRTANRETLSASRRPPDGRSADLRRDEGIVDPMFDVVNIARDAGVTPPADCPTIVRYMLGRPLDTDPGTYYSYLNVGYCVLGQVIEQVSGETVESFVTANVTGPLGNDRSQFGATLTALPGEVTYYDYPGASLASSVFPTGPSLVPWPYGGFSLEANHANGGLVSSTIDLLRFLTSVNGSRGPQLFANPVSGFPGYVPPYGAGWEWVFDGSLPGNNAGLILMPDQSALCFLTNTRPIPSPTANFF